MTPDVRHATEEKDRRARSTSIDEVRQLSAAAFDTSSVDLLHPADPFEVRYQLSRIGPFTLGDITYGADVRLNCLELSDGYRVTIPIDGVVESRHRGRRLPASPDLAAVYPPRGETLLTRWPARSRILAVKIDALAVDHALAQEQQSRRARPRHPEFVTGIDLEKGAGRGWKQLMLAAGRQLGDDDSPLNHPLVASPFAETLMKSFLLAASPGYARAHAASHRPVPPGTVRRAVDLIESAPQFPWTTDALAERCYVRPRTLQNSFRRQLGATPMEYVRTVRLRRAHRELREADPYETSVTQVAHRWGFFHLGRFSAAYKEVYGESPRHTLRA